MVEQTWGRGDIIAAASNLPEVCSGSEVLDPGPTTFETTHAYAAPGAYQAIISADADGTVQPFEGDTAIFITPGYRFRAVDGLVTNFHLPRSTLLMLVSALAGRDKTLQAYALAVAKQYRFFSYGDAMMVI